VCDGLLSAERALRKLFLQWIDAKRINGTIERVILAEREGFEPSIQETCIPDFESGAFDHSATFPRVVSLVRSPQF
jgi:hypothetical protein